MAAAADLEAWGRALLAALDKVLHELEYVLHGRKTYAGWFDRVLGSVLCPLLLPHAEAGCPAPPQETPAGAGGTRESELRPGRPELTQRRREPQRGKAAIEGRKD